MEHVNTRGVIGDESALVKAAQEGHRPRIESLLAAGADVNEVNGAGETAVMKAAEARNSRCLQLLVNAGADVNARDCNGVTALLKAAWAHNVECMSILLKAGADVNYLSEDCRGRATTALMDAAETNHPECVKFLIEAGADVNKITLHSYGGTSALTFAASNGSYKCLDLLAAAGADVNACNDTFSTLTLSVLHGYEPVTDGLWTMQDNFVSRFVQNSLTDDQFMRQLSGDDVNDSIECVKILLKTGARMNIKNKHGHNALQCYIVECKPVVQELAMLLFAAGETIDGPAVEKQERFGRLRRVKVPDYLQMHELSLVLKHMCRVTIRKHLQAHAHSNLFLRVPKLGLPSLVTEYLLFDVSLD